MELRSGHKYLGTRKSYRNKNHNYWRLNLVMTKQFKSRLKNDDSEEKCLVKEENKDCKVVIHK